MVQILIFIDFGNFGFSFHNLNMILKLLILRNNDIIEQIERVSEI